MIGRHLIKAWSSTQPSVSLSSGEAEMVGVTKAAAAALGFRSLMADLGVDWPVRIWTDSSAFIGMCTRQGIGKVRHMDAQIMWIQQRVRNNDLDLYKVAGEKNPADIFTKAVKVSGWAAAVLMLNIKPRKDRAKSCTKSLQRCE